MIITVLLSAITLAYAKGLSTAVPVVPLTAFLILRGYGRFYHGTRIRPIVDSLATIVLFSACFALLIDVFAVNTTLRDDWLIQADEWLGCDAQAISDWVSQYSWLSSLSYWIYFSMIPQIVIVLMMGHQETFVRRFMICAVMTACIFQLMPAIGNYATPEPHTAPIVARTLALSSGAVRSVDCMESEGIVCAPSFHVITAILIAAALWGTCLQWPALIWNIAMIASTVPTGGHYVVDLALGGLVALSVIVSYNAR